MSEVRNGPHDLGGVSGFGPIDRTPDTAAYPEGWEGRCIAAIVATMAGGAYNVDEFRARIEELPPAAHFAMGYYRRWFHSLERNLLTHGVLTREEIAARQEEIGAGGQGVARGGEAAARGGEAAARGGTADADDRRDPGLLATVEALLRDGGPLVRELDAAPRFAVGDRVRTRRIVVERLGEQHTRLPGYAQERCGVVECRYPPMTLPDASVAGEDRADFLYAVSFAAADLWLDGEPGVRVSADLFESYLEAEED
jgi:nitrile hydratase beta subunit